MAAPAYGPFHDVDARIVSLWGKIDTADINRVIDLLLRFDAASAKPVTIFVNCQGGDVSEGLKLIDTLSLLRSPVMTVGLGLIEGAGLLLLAAAQQRVLFPSAILSTSGLWDLPHLHEAAKRTMGLRHDAQIGDQLCARICGRMTDLVTAVGSKLPSLLADQNAPPQIFDATAAIRVGLADAIIHGPHRLLVKPKSKLNLHAQIGITPSL